MSETTKDEETAAAIRVEPFDEHNRKLVENVHPPSWRNPQPKSRYHLVAVGAGTGGLVSAAGSAGLGARVALVERHLMGGDCLNVGCVPSKGVIRAARAWKAAAEASRRFGGPQVSGAGDFAVAMERMRRLRAGISPHDSVQRFADLGLDVFLGHGEFVGPDRIAVDGKELRFRRAVIATGARAAAPPIPGLEEAGYLTNETVFSLTELPGRLLVIGAGPIGCEMAQSFARFGSKVTILDRADHVLPREDPDAARIVEKSMVDDGVSYEPRVTITGAERNGEERVLRFERDGVEGSISGDQILVAVGRAPNVEGLGLEAAGVAHDQHGVTVDDELRTTNRRIFAVGDVCSKYKFTHAADAHARIVIANSLFFLHGKSSRLVIPWCTYTSPEIAHVGYYEKQAEEAGFNVETLTVPLNEVDRAILDGEDEGFLRLHIERGRDRILGGTLVAEHAGDMIGELALAVQNRIGLKKISNTIHPYPTQAEVYRKAADAWRRKGLTPGVKSVLAFFFRLFK